MGAVYRATHTLMGKPCAVKVLRGPQASQELAWKRFQREAQSASRLDHEHCIRVTDFGRTDDGIAYLVMELLEGRSLAEELAATGALPVARAVALARQVLSALAHAHALGVVHRDLKPDNIMLVERGGAEHVKVLDFGLAKLVETARPEGGSLSTLSEMGSVFGTPEYMSPEQAQGASLDARTDLYSFGVVLYQMLTGQLPFQGVSFLAILSKHLTETPVSPAAKRPDLALPPALVSLVMRCLEKDAAKRPPSAQEMLDALGSMSLEAAAPRVPEKVAASPTVELSQLVAHRRRWPLWGGAGVVLLGVIAAVVGRGERATGNRQPATGNRQPEETAVAAVVADAAAVAVAVPDAAPDPDPVAVPAPVPDAAPAPAAIAEEPEAKPRRSEADVHVARAARYRKAGNEIKELFHLQQALKLEPDHREANYRLGAALIDGGQRELGCAHLARGGGKAARTLAEKAGCSSD